MMTDNTFWMSLGDFIDHFRSFTVCYNDPTIHTRIVPADLDAHGAGGVTKDGWAVLHLRCKIAAANVCVRLSQLDRRSLADKSRLLTYEYAMMTVIVVKKARVPPRTEYGTYTQEFCYIDGIQGRKQAVDVRVQSLRPGDLYVLYKVDWKDEHDCQKLNLAVSGPDNFIGNLVARRMDPSSYHEYFFSHMMDRHMYRLGEAAHFEQPAV